MTWIFWRSEFWDVGEMIVCSVFLFFQSKNVCCPEKTKINKGMLLFFSHAFLFFFSFSWFFFWHKLTWREYFDALWNLRCERWLCAPFFSLFFSSFFFVFFFFTKHYTIVFLNFGPFSIFARFLKNMKIILFSQFR